MNSFVKLLAYNFSLKFCLLFPVAYTLRCYISLLKRFAASVSTPYYTRWSQKVSHYQVSSLNHIKNRHCAYISHQF